MLDLNRLNVVTWMVIAVAYSFACFSAGELWDYQIKDYKEHPCNRQCHDLELPRVCKYDFLVENYYVLSKACRECPFNQSDCWLPHCVPADGTRRGIKVVNRMLPGPAIQVCQGDTIEVTVHNSLDSGEGTSIHWHGILQQGTPYMDGVSMVTQCPITYHSHFTYNFVANDAGTHYWHSHSGVQRADGLFGPLIVRQTPSREPHSALYHRDLPEHVMTVTDWLTGMATDRVSKYLHYDYDNKPRSMLINGMGRYSSYKKSSSSGSVPVYTPYAVFTVEKGLKHRFRVISSGIMNCAIQLSIDGHNLTVIASDGQPVEPVTIDSFNIYSGERFDFIIDADSQIGNYWIRVRGYGNCELYKTTQTAILRYHGAQDQLPPERTTWFEAIGAGTRLNSARETLSLKDIEMTHLLSKDPDDSTMTAVPDKKFYLAIDFVQVENLRAHNPQFYSFESTKPTNKFYSPQINWISNQLPPSPPLTQLEDLPEELFCNAESVQKHCQKEWCACVHLYQVALGDLVELVLVDLGTISHAYHPMHLHGHKFRLVGMGKLNASTTVEIVKQMDMGGQLNRTRTKAPIKDTVIVPDGGYTIIRFRADNPGVWLLHCHVEFHAETGMAIIFQVGEASEFSPRPKQFPTCGNWKLSH